VHTPHYYLARNRKLYAKKLRSWKLYKTFRTVELLAKYRRLSKACSCSVKHFQNHIEENLANNENLSSFYKYVNSRLNGSNGIALLTDKHGNLVTSYADKTALINSYFSSIFTADNGVVNPAKLPNPGFSTAAPPFLLLL
jgi:hypothetical protein